MMVEYRDRPPVTNEDLNALRASAWERADGRDWRPVFERSLTWLCAYEGERLVGFVNVAWDGDRHAFVLDTTVLPSLQRKGIGTELVRRAARVAKERGAEWLHVDAGADLAAFYEGCGFRPAQWAGLIRLADLE